MRVLFVCSGNSRSGISAITRVQGESLRKLGIDVRYFPISEPGLKGYLKHTAKLRYFLGIQRPDIVHAHYGLCGLVTQLSLTKQKTVVSFMGNDIFGSVGTNNRYTRISRLMSEINKALAKCRYDHVIVKSFRQLAASGLSSRVTVIPNGVDMTQFYSMQKEGAQTHLGWDVETKNVLFAADPSRAEKNIILANAALTLIGDPTIRLYVLNQAPHGDMIWYYNAADVLILTSIHEGSPNVIKEAMASNCPIVSTDVGDVREVIDGVEGCYVTSFEPEDVADKIEKSIRFDRRTEGRQRIEALGLDSDSIAKRIINVYEHVLGI